jgi:hypothetical protein
MLARQQQIFVTYFGIQDGGHHCRSDDPQSPTATHPKPCNGEIRTPCDTKTRRTNERIQHSREIEIYIKKQKERKKERKENS